MILNPNFDIQKFIDATAININETVDHRGNIEATYKVKIACNVVLLFEKFHELTIATIAEIASMKTAAPGDNRTLDLVLKKSDDLLSAVKAHCDSLKDKMLAMDVAMLWVCWVSDYAKELKAVQGQEMLSDYLHNKIIQLPLEYKKQIKN